MNTKHYSRKYRILKNSIKKINSFRDTSPELKLLTFDKLKRKIKTLFCELSFVFSKRKSAKPALAFGIVLSSVQFSDAQNFQNEIITNVNSMEEEFAFARFVDMDNDGDLDLIAREETGFTQYYYHSIKYYQNNSVGNQIQFDFVQYIFEDYETELDQSDYAYNNFKLEDIDLDGDLDFLIERVLYDDYSSNDRIRYKLNIGSPTAPLFNTLDPISINSTLINNGASDYCFIDIDHDNDSDLFYLVGNNVLFLENLGTSTPTFANAIINPFGITINNLHKRFIFEDIDSDGDFDLLTGNEQSMILSANTGSATNPSFSALQVAPYNLILGTANPTSNFYPYKSFLGQFVDMDHDHDLDFIKQDGSTFKYYENTGTTTPVFGTPVDNPFNLITVDSYNYVFEVKDLEGDGDFDVLGKNLKNNTEFHIYIDSATHVDLDNDGYNELLDCDDNSVDINPGITEICDGIDNNCNGQIDEGFVYYVDSDGDSFGAGIESVFCSDPGAGFSLNNADCDDTDASIYSDATDIPNNGIDEDCSGADLVIDVDGDGFNSDDDCNDAVASINPNATEIPNNDIDEDCSGSDLVIDIDGDGFNSDDDCDDTIAGINPDATEIPNNGIDEDCSGADLSTIGIAENNSNQFTLFPNPGSDFVVLKLNKTVSRGEIKVLNSLGAEIMKVSFTNKDSVEIKTDQLKSGIYYFEVNDAEKKSLIKWVKI